MPRRRLPHGTLLALLALLAALLVAGCGGDDAATSSAGPDPATVAPADAFLYGEVVVRPTEDVEAGARAALEKVLRVDDPGVELRRLIDDGLAESGEDMTYADNIEPWLGERAGGFLLLSSESVDEPEGAIAVAVKDQDALETELDRQRDSGELRSGGAYKGVDYDLDGESGDPNAAIGDLFVVASSIEAFRAAVDASRGESLADTSRYETALNEVADDALAFLFVDPQTLARQLGSVDEVDPQLRRALRSSRIADAEPVVASLTATADEIAFEASADSTLAGDALDAGGDEAVTVGELPGDAWLALATPPLGPAIRQALDSAGVLDEAAAQLRRGVGLDLERDLLGVIGGLGVFARGSSLLAVGGGVLLRTTSEAGAQRLLRMLESIVGAAGVGPMRPIATGGARGFQLAIPQAPQAIVVLAKGAAIAAGYPASSAQALLDPQQRFDDSSDGGAAIDSLGEGFEPSFVLIASPLVDLLGSLDQLQVFELSDALPYLRAYRSLAIGTRHDDERTTVRGVLTLR